MSVGRDPVTAPRRVPRKSGYLPSLDGWRAFAILGVMMTHDLPWTVGRLSNAAWKGYGGWGVYLFFAISGILICTRILEEESLTGGFRLKPFYIRRVLRIQPAALVYLGVIATLIALGIIHERWHYWSGAFFLYANFLFRNSDLSATMAFTGHFWTLAVEEHFYILLSLLLVCFRKRRIAIFAGLIALIYISQIVAIHFGRYSEDVSGRRTYWLILYLLVPAWFALLLRVPRIRVLVDRFLVPWVAYLATLLFIVPGALHHYSHQSGFWSISLIAGAYPRLFLIFSLWLIATMFHPRSLSTRILELPPIRFVGRISYSLYLWHVLFFVPIYSDVGVHAAPLLFLATRPWKYIVSFTAAVLSYYFIEKPLIRLGHRLAPPATPGHVDTAIHPSEFTAQAASYT